MHQRPPGRIAGVVGRGDQEFAVTEYVGHINLGAARAPGIAEEHHVETVGRERWALIVEALDQDALARTVRLHHPDAERAAPDAGEGDKVAARRPDWRRVAAVAE